MSYFLMLAAWFIIYGCGVKAEREKDSDSYVIGQIIVSLIIGGGLMYCASLLK